MGKAINCYSSKQTLLDSYKILAFFEYNYLQHLCSCLIFFVLSAGSEAISAQLLNFLIVGRGFSTLGVFEWSKHFVSQWWKFLLQLSPITCIYDTINYLQALKFSQQKARWLHFWYRLYAGNPLFVLVWSRTSNSVFIFRSQGQKAIDVSTIFLYNTVTHSQTLKFPQQKAWTLHF